MRGRGAGDLPPAWLPQRGAHCWGSGRQGGGCGHTVPELRGVPTRLWKSGLFLTDLSISLYEVQKVNVDGNSRVYLPFCLISSVAFMRKTFLTIQTGPCFSGFPRQLHLSLSAGPARLGWQVAECFWASVSPKRGVGWNQTFPKPSDMLRGKRVSWAKKFGTCTLHQKF